MAKFIVRQNCEFWTDVEAATIEEAIANGGLKIDKVVVLCPDNVGPVWSSVECDENDC